MAKNKDPNILDLCEKFKSRGQKIAVLSFGAEDERKLHFKDMHELIGQLAAGLKQAGLERQETMMILANNSPDFMIAALAIIYAGGICVPIDVQSSDEVLKHVIKDSNTKRVFTDAIGLERLHCVHQDKHMEIVRLDDEKASNSWHKLLTKADTADLEIKAEDQAVLFIPQEQRAYQKVCHSLIQILWQKSRL
jgi:long-chain acyl-CoA synthetase